MKKSLISVCCILVSCLLFGQINSKEYNDLIKRADSLYEAKDFKNSGLTYSLAFNSQHAKPGSGDRHYAASSWALANYPDSSFFQLDLLVNSDYVTITDYLRVSNDNDLTSLHTDKRWQPVLAKILNSAEKHEIDIFPVIKIKLRDGILLNATVYKPHIQNGKLPVIFSLTPYISDTYHDRGVYFANHGYVYLNIDARGRGGSEGIFNPFMQEAKDGYDIVEWLAKQTYCNGKITMWGGSYAGYDQWATAKELPPHLRTIVPVASPKPGIEHPMHYNVGYPYIIQWLTFTGGKAGNLNLFQDQQYWRGKFIERYINDLPFSSFDSLVGYPNKIWKDYQAHPLVDDFYKKMNPNSVQYGKMKLPILTITGMYDADQTGALSFYKEFMKYATTAAKEKHYLIIGPWDHAGTRTPTKVQAGITMGDSSLLDMNDLHRQWYDYTLKDSAKPAFLRDKVMYYVTNKDHWKSAASLDDIGKEKLLFYLNTNYNEGKVLQDSAVLQKELAVDGKPAVYVYDPLNKTDNPSIVYSTATFEKDTEVSGFFKLDAYIETNVKDIDIGVRIFELRSNGQKVRLTEPYILRARYRESLEKEKLLIPGVITPFHFDKFTFASRVIEKGSRIQMTIYSPNSPYDQKNYCSGGIVANETAKDALVATIKIYNDSKHPSVLFVPVMQ